MVNNNPTLLAINKFINNFTEVIDELISKINKKINRVIYGDFNIDLLKTDIHAPTNLFLETTLSHPSTP